MGLKKRNAHVLILRYLADQGYVRCVDELEAESGVSLLDYDTADNVSLSVVLQDYEDNYERRYHRKPKLVKPARKAAAPAKQTPSKTRGRASPQRKVADAKRQPLVKQHAGAGAQGRAHASPAKTVRKRDGKVDHVRNNIRLAKAAAARSNAGRPAAGPGNRRRRLSSVDDAYDEEEDEEDVARGQPVRGRHAFALDEDEEDDDDFVMARQRRVPKASRKAQPHVGYRRGAYDDDELDAGGDSDDGGYYRGDGGARLVHRERGPAADGGARGERRPKPKVYTALLDHEELELSPAPAYKGAKQQTLANSPLPDMEPQYLDERDGSDPTMRHFNERNARLLPAAHHHRHTDLSPRTEAPADVLHGVSRPSPRLTPARQQQPEYMSALANLHGGPTDLERRQANEKRQNLIRALDEQVREKERAKAEAAMRERRLREMEEVERIVRGGGVGTGAASRVEADASPLAVGRELSREDLPIRGGKNGRNSKLHHKFNRKLPFETPPPKGHHHSHHSVSPGAALSPLEPIESRHGYAGGHIPERDLSPAFDVVDEADVDPKTGKLLRGGPRLRHD